MEPRLQQVHGPVNARTWLERRRTGDDPRSAFDVRRAPSLPEHGDLNYQQGVDGHPYRGLVQDVGSKGTADLALIDVCGDAGADGARGADGRGGQSYGETGGRGGDAGPASDGQHAGHIRLMLGDGGAGMLTLQGTFTPPGKAEQPFDAAVFIRDEGTVVLRAIGGRGGDGGIGGDGGDGAAGRPGADATRYSSGEDGGSGGAGGHGGNGTLGARGGDGGKIHLRVGEDETHLLMLVDHNVSGGAGGASGRNGRGGRGGRGGPGGDSYSWTESESYTDSNGQSQTRTTWHSNPGGSRGSDGPDGSWGFAHLVPGAPGASGQFAIEVLGEQGRTERFSSRFDLRLSHFVVAEIRPDGVYEPGEVVRVQAVQVTNAGGMPMPRRSAVRLGLVAGRWLKPEGDEMTCPPALPALQEAVVAGELRARIDDHEPREPADPLAETVTIEHRAWIPDIRRAFTSYCSPEVAALGTLLIQWPVRLAPLEYLHSLAPGESTRVRLSLSSIASRALGAAAPDGRRLRVRVRAAAESELGDEHVALWGGGTALDPSIGWLHEVDLLDPHATVHLEFDVTIRPSVPTYRAFTAYVTVELGRLDFPDKPRPIQIRALEIRVARPFVPDDADVLLVVNHRTTHEVLAAWEAMAARLMARLAVWDLSREGHFDLDRPLCQGRTLGQVFGGKAMVVLDNTFEGPDGPVRAHALLDAAQLRGAAMSGLDVAIVGDRFDLRSRLIPPPARPGQVNVQIVEDTDAVVQALRHGPRTVTSMERTFWLPWRQPSAAWLERQARALSARLDRVLPHRRHIVVHRFAPELLQSSFWRRRWRIGTLETMRTLDTTASAVVHAEATDAQVNDPAFVQSHTAAIAVLTMLDFEEQLERLRWTLANEPVDAKVVDQVTSTLLADLVNELVVANAGGPGPDVELEQAMPRLRALRERAGFTTIESESGQVLVRFAASLVLVAEAHVPWLVSSATKN